MRKYSTEFKLEVVQSFLAGDGGAKLLARRWPLPEEKIRSWVSHYRPHGIGAHHPMTPKATVESAANRAGHAMPARGSAHTLE